VRLSLRGRPADHALDVRWLGRFDAPLPVRCRGRFHLYAAHAADRRVLVIVPAQGFANASTAQCLERLAGAHRALSDVPGILPLHEHGEAAGQPFVALGCDAVADGEWLVARAGELGAKLEHRDGLAVIDRLSGALAAAHERGFCLGSLAWSNVVLDAGGALHWVGFGHNICTLDEELRSAGAPATFVAPEVAAGGAVSAAGDVHAFFQLQQALLPYVELPEAVRRAFGGGVDPRDLDQRFLAELLQFLASRVLLAPAGQRATLRETREWAARERAHFRLQLDEAATRAALRALIASEDEPGALSPAEPSQTWTFAQDGAWLRTPGGERFSLSSRPSRRLLLALLKLRQERSGAWLDHDALLAAGWPSEHPLPEAGLNRIYVALSGLRKAGLRALLQHGEEGYRLDPAAAIAMAPP
jgi:hypothetical protein